MELVARLAFYHGGSGKQYALGDRWQIASRNVVGRSDRARDAGGSEAKVCRPIGDCRTLQHGDVPFSIRWTSDAWLTQAKLIITHRLALQGPLPVEQEYGRVLSRVNRIVVRVGLPSSVSCPVLAGWSTRKPATMTSRPLIPVCPLSTSVSLL